MTVKQMMECDPSRIVTVQFLALRIPPDAPYWATYETVQHEYVVFVRDDTPTVLVAWNDVLYRCKDIMEQFNYKLIRFGVVPLWMKQPGMIFATKPVWESEIGLSELTITLKTGWGNGKASKDQRTDSTTDRHTDATP